MITAREHINIYKNFEKQNIFDIDPNPIETKKLLPVTEDFAYLPTKIGKFCNTLKKALIINPFSFYENKFVLKTKVFGRDNLKGIKSAIVTCNHIFIYDCLAVKWALKGKKLKYCVAEHNNRKGFLGNMMRAEGILPLSKKFGVLKKFSNAVEHYLLHNNLVLFYPEQAMWYMYEKPRPLKDGAFYYATKFDVPILPLFITLRSSNKFDKEGLPIKYFTVHIGKIINIQKSKTAKENIIYLKEQNTKWCKQVYEDTYKKVLVYDIKNSFMETKN